MEERQRRRHRHHHHHRPAWTAPHVAGDLLGSASHVSSLDRENQFLAQEVRRLKGEAEDNKHLRDEQLRCVRCRGIGAAGPHVAPRTVSRLTNEVKDLTASQSKWRAHLAELSERNSALVAEVVALVGAKAKANAELQALRSKQHAVDETERELAGLRSHQAHLYTSATSVEATNAQLQAQLAAANKRQEATAAALARAERDVADLRARLGATDAKRAEAERACAQKDAAIESLRLDVDQARRHEEVLHTGTRHAEAGLLDASTECQQLRSSLRDADARLQRAASELTSLSQATHAHVATLQTLQDWCRDAAACLTAVGGMGLPKTAHGDVAVVCPPAAPDFAASEFLGAGDLPAVITGASVQAVADDAAARLDRAEAWTAAVTDYLDRTTNAALLQHGKPDAAANDALSVADKMQLLVTAAVEAGMRESAEAAHKAESDRLARKRDADDKVRRAAAAQQAWAAIQSRAAAKFSHIEGEVERLVKEVVSSRHEVSTLSDTVGRVVR